MDAENIGQHFNMSCITKTPFLHFPAKDNKAIILFSTLMFCRRNTHPVNFSPLLRFWGIRLCIICFDFFFLQTLELLGCILCCSFCQCTHLWTCRVNLLTDILAQCTSPPLLKLPPLPLPPPHTLTPAMLFPPPGLTSPGRHAGASSSAPNYSLANSSTEKTSNCYETEGNNLRPRGRAKRWRGSPPAVLARCGPVRDPATILWFKLRHQRGPVNIMRARIEDVEM